MQSKLYTLDEAADILRLTNRGVAKIVRRHGLCMVRGRTLLFSDADIEGIKNTMRVAPTDLRPVPIKPTPSDFQIRQSLTELTKKKRRRAAK